MSTSHSELSLEFYLVSEIMKPCKNRAIIEFKRAEEKYLKWREKNGGFDQPLPDVELKMPYGDELTNDEEPIEKW